MNAPSKILLTMTAWKFGAIKKATVLWLTTFAAVGFVLPASAGYNATVTGTVVSVQQMSTSMATFTPETVVFALSTQPALSCGSGFSMFIISPNSVTDAPTRRNFLALLLMAKSTGGQVEVGYDSASSPGNSCDQGYPIVYWIQAQ